MVDILMHGLGALIGLIPAVGAPLGAILSGVGTTVHFLGIALLG